MDVEVCECEWDGKNQSQSRSQMDNIVLKQWKYMHAEQGRRGVAGGEGEPTGAAQCWRAPNWDWGKQEQAIKGKSGICATTLNRCRHTRTHPHIHLSPFPIPLFSMPKHPLEQLSSTPRRVRLKLLRYCAPKRHVLPPSLSPPLSLLLSLPLSILCVFFVFLLFYYFAHIRRTLTVRVLPPVFFMFRAQWILASTRTSNTVRVLAPVPSSTQHTTTTQKSLTIKKNVYIAHAKKKTT